MKFLRAQHGTSLMEVIVATAIFSIIVAAIYTTFSVGNLSWGNSEANIRAQQEVRKGLAAMGRDLRMATGITLTQNATTLSLSFTHPADGTVTYTWASTGGSAQQLIRQRTIGSPTSRIVAQNISAITVTNNSANIAVNITATVANANGKNRQFQLAKTVAKR